MTQYDAPKCLECVHLKKNPYTVGSIPCTAFPKGIPDEILESRVSHTKPYPGDHGIQFKKK